MTSFLASEHNSALNHADEQKCPTRCRMPSARLGSQLRSLHGQHRRGQACHLEQTRNTPKSIQSTAPGIYTSVQCSTWQMSKTAWSRRYRMSLTILRWTRNSKPTRQCWREAEKEMCPRSTPIGSGKTEGNEDLAAGFESRSGTGPGDPNVLHPHLPGKRKERRTSKSIHSAVCCTLKNRRTIGRTCYSRETQEGCVEDTTQDGWDTIQMEESIGFDHEMMKRSESTQINYRYNVKKKTSV